MSWIHCRLICFTQDVGWGTAELRVKTILKLRYTYEYLDKCKMNWLQPVILYMFLFPQMLVELINDSMFSIYIPNTNIDNELLLSSVPRYCQNIILQAISQYAQSHVLRMCLPIHLHEPLALCFTCILSVSASLCSAPLIFSCIICSIHAFVKWKDPSYRYRKCWNSASQPSSLDWETEIMFQTNEV